MTTASWMSGMAGRTEITGMQRGILLESFSNGMQNCSKETLAMRDAAARKTGLGIKSVNVRKCS